ncbi:hypothetical protein SH449x_001811 [Pirellulaceae bacterium SH449]
MSNSDTPDIESRRQRLERVQSVRNLWYLNPIDLASASLSFLSDWWNTRDWKKLAIIIPPFLLLFGLGSMVLAGKLMQKTVLMGWYQNQSQKVVDEIVEVRNESKDPAPEQMAKADLLLSRILQLGAGNLPSRFFVAQQNIVIGRLDVARSIISQIAPENRPGLAEAHAWMARDLVARATKGESISMEVLRHHLQNSLERFDLNFEPALYEVYASMLDKENRYNEAAKLLVKAGEINPNLQLRVIDYQKQKGFNNQAKGSADAIIAKAEAMIKNTKNDPADIAREVVLAARAYTMTDRFDESINFLTAHPPTDLNMADWRRTFSENFRAKFRKSLAREGTQVQVNLSFLSNAIKADPTNLSIAGEINLLSEIGLAATPEQRKVLIDLMAQQGNSLAPKMVLAQAALKEDRLDEAVRYYELVLAEAPDCIVVLNNLAAIYSKKPQPNLDKALELIEKAIALNPSVAEFRDTKADIELLAGKNDSAESEYLKALELAPALLTTREKLIKFYVSTGNQTEADRQQEIYNKVKEELERLQTLREKEFADRKAAEEAKEAERLRMLEERIKPKESQAEESDQTSQEANAQSSTSDDKVDL